VKVIEGAGYTMVDTAGAHVLIVQGKGCMNIPDDLAEVIRVGHSTVAVAQAMEAKWTGGKAVEE
jgi:hypothetical protein